jgi:hypothetical protein
LEIGIFIPSGSHFDNEIPKPHERRDSVFWHFMGPLFNLPPEHVPWDAEGVSSAIATIRAYETRRADANNSAAPTVTLGDLAQEAVTHVVEAVKTIKKPSHATAP